MIEIRNLTKKRINGEVYKKLYKKIFPPNGKAGARKIELSLVFAPPSLMRKLNKVHRNKNKAANVLSFPLGHRQGEIFLNAAEKSLPYLFLHGALHLLGYDHNNEKGAKKMEKLEKKILNK